MQCRIVPYIPVSIALDDFTLRFSLSVTLCVWHDIIMTQRKKRTRMGNDTFQGNMYRIVR